MDEVAVDHPTREFVLAHVGNPWLTDAAEVVYKNLNVWADLSGLVVGDAEVVRRTTERRETAGRGGRGAAAGVPLRGAAEPVPVRQRLAAGADGGVPGVGGGGDARGLPRAGVRGNARGLFRLGG